MFALSCKPFTLYCTSSLSYNQDVEIKRGWKGGTRLKFEQVDPGFEVIFVIQEGKHDRFERDGNNLQTTISITKSKARKGCSLFIDPLSDVELPVIVKLKPGEVSHDGQVVTVKGRGWPRRKNGDKGDLLVKVNLVPDSKYGRGGRIKGLFKRKVVNKKPRKRWRS
jgi:DnaJ-class molecular chaperone